MRNLKGTVGGRRLAAAAMTMALLGACGRPAPVDEAQTGAAPDPAAQGTTPSSATVDAEVPSGEEQTVQSESMSESADGGGEAMGDGQTTEPAESTEAAAPPVLTADGVTGVVDSTPGRAGVKVTSQNPIVAPTPTTTASTVPENVPTGTGGVHVVEAGDTLSGIAETYGVPVQAIADANGLLDVDDLQLGQELQIPAAN